MTAELKQKPQLTIKVGSATKSNVIFQNDVQYLKICKQGTFAYEMKTALRVFHGRPGSMKTRGNET